MRTTLLLSVVLSWSCGTAAPSPDGTPTWYRDAQPIVAANCGNCHTAGGIGPFPLVTYEDFLAVKGAAMDSITARRMPPWTPSESCEPLRESRRLTQPDYDTLTAWAAGAFKKGDPAQAVGKAPQGLALPWVDLTLQPSQAYTPEKTGNDDYRCFVLDPNLPGARDLIGFQVEPGVPAEVHHVLLYSASRAEAQKLDDASPGFGWKCYGGPGTNYARTLGAWAPGSLSTRFPSGTGVRMFDGDIVIMQVHYNLANATGAQGVPDLTKVKFQFAQRPVAFVAEMFPLVEQDFAIPPNSVGHSTSVAFESPVAGQVWGLLPHMHTRGKRIKVELERPGAASQCLVDIPQWDFGWQQAYFFQAQRGLPVKAGDRLKLSCSWDNPSAKTVRWGENTDDEMCLAFVVLTSPTGP